VLNMSRQVGSAVGVALLVALTSGADPITGYDHAWSVQAAAGLLAAIGLVTFGRRTTRAGGNLPIPRQLNRMERKGR
jgi:hypothetical protein